MSLFVNLSKNVSRSSSGLQAFVNSAFNLNNKKRTLKETQSWFDRNQKEEPLRSLASRGQQTLLFASHSQSNNNNDNDNNTTVTSSQEQGSSHQAQEGTSQAQENEQENENDHDENENENNDGQVPVVNAFHLLNEASHQDANRRKAFREAAKGNFAPYKTYVISHYKSQLNTCVDGKKRFKGSLWFHPEDSVFCDAKQYGLYALPKVYFATWDDYDVFRCVRGENGKKLGRIQASCPTCKCPDNVTKDSFRFLDVASNKLRVVSCII